MHGASFRRSSLLRYTKYAGLIDACEVPPSQRVSGDSPLRVGRKSIPRVVARSTTLITLEYDFVKPTFQSSVTPTTASTVPAEKTAFGMVARPARLRTARMPPEVRHTPIRMAQATHAVEPSPIATPVSAS